MSKKSKRKNRQKRDKTWRDEIPAMPAFVFVPMCDAAGDVECKCNMSERALNLYVSAVASFDESIDSCIAEVTDTYATWEPTPEDGEMLMVGVCVVSSSHEAKRVSKAITQKMGAGMKRHKGWAEREDGTGPKEPTTIHELFGIATFQDPETPDMPPWAFCWTLHVINHDKEPTASRN